MHPPKTTIKIDGYLINQLPTFVLKNLRRLLDKYAVARTEHDAHVKSTMKIFSNFETQTLIGDFMFILNKSSKISFD